MSSTGFITRPAADPFKTGMGTPATSVLPAYIFILHFEPRLVSLLYGRFFKTYAQLYADTVSPSALKHVCVGVSGAIPGIPAISSTDASL